MNAPRLLKREDFRTQVLARNEGKCVLCADRAVDAHHILERRLWPDGGYYLENGAGVCARHHMMCETTEVSVEEVRRAAGIARAVLPPHLYEDQAYDKWGNIMLPSGARLRGELFEDASVQKVLASAGVLDLFCSWVKYPRTHHVPWSEGMHDDDRMLDNVTAFEGEDVVATEKMDGENTTLYRDHIHARSVDSGGHPSRSWVKGFWGQICGDIPEGWRVCGENLYAKHSIGYQELPSYFMGFSIWNEKNVCLDWDSTLEWFKLLGITPVPVLYRGVFDEKKIRALYRSQDHATREGYVLRFAGEIPYGDFRRRVGKFVRKDHVTTVSHWRHAQIVPNLLKADATPFGEVP